MIHVDGILIQMFVLNNKILEYNIIVTKYKLIYENNTDLTFNRIDRIAQ